MSVTNGGGKPQPAVDPSARLGWFVLFCLLAFILLEVGLWLSAIDLAGKLAAQGGVFMALALWVAVA